MKKQSKDLFLFEESSAVRSKEKKDSETIERLQRLDNAGDLRNIILPYCRLAYGQVWVDPVNGHKVGVLDATNKCDVSKIFGEDKAKLILNDPPYNITVGNANTRNLFKINLKEYLDFSRRWIENSIKYMDNNSHLYVWLGADYRNHFEPLADFMIMMRDYKELKPKNYITMRNQRGYGTQRNWMWIRQELLYYEKGNPNFNVQAEYTDIPKILKGYYKQINGKITENLERSKSNCIRAGNVWVDIQQVFYRLEENVPGCYAQKPLKAIERIILSSTSGGDLVGDFFAHSGTTLIAGDKLGRKVYTFDLDPIFAEITIRRLENFRKYHKTGWQWLNPFPEIERNHKV